MPSLEFELVTWQVLHAARVVLSLHDIDWSYWILLISIDHWHWYESSKRHSFPLESIESFFFWAHWQAQPHQWSIASLDILQAHKRARLCKDVCIINWCRMVLLSSLLFAKIVSWNLRGYHDASCVMCVRAARSRAPKSHFLRRCCELLRLVEASPENCSSIAEICDNVWNSCMNTEYVSIFIYNVWIMWICLLICWFHQGCEVGDCQRGKPVEHETAPHAPRYLVVGDLRDVQKHCGKTVQLLKAVCQASGIPTAEEVIIV